MRGALAATVGGLVLYGAFPIGALAASSASKAPVIPMAGVVESAGGLRLKPSDPQRTKTLGVGDAYGEGWVLSVISASQFGIRRGDETLILGMDGRVLEPASPSANTPAEVRVVFSDAELRKVHDSPEWKYGAPYPGLSLAETELYLAYQFRLDDYFTQHPELPDSDQTRQDALGVEGVKDLVRMALITARYISAR